MQLIFSDCLTNMHSSYSGSCFTPSDHYSIFSKPFHPLVRLSKLLNFLLNINALTDSWEA